MSNEHIEIETNKTDRLLAAMCYPILPIVILIFIENDKRNQHFLRYHALHAVLFNILLLALYYVIGAVTFGYGSIFVPLLWIVNFWPAIDAYNGEYVDMPVISNFVKNRGWV
jgi:uncharacterized membrane protein